MSFLPKISIRVLRPLLARAGTNARQLRWLSQVSEPRPVEKHLPDVAADDSELAFLAAATLAEQDIDTSPLHHQQLITSPLLTYSILKNRTADFPSRGLLGTSGGERVYVNTNAPSSAVICGVQGSGKSHTVSCLLECGLIPDPRVGQLPQPLSGLVLHFDTQDSGRPCEAAFLSSPTAHNGVPPEVTVLCSPGNVKRRRRVYAPLRNVRVKALSLSEKDLTADRMLVLMGCEDLDTMPLYMHTALRIIRDLGAESFSYLEFSRRIEGQDLNRSQRAMLKLRLDLLDAFVLAGGDEIESHFTAGGLVIVDLTDPFLDSLTATVLFDAVLGAFTQWQTGCGKLVVLDEAHKYLVNSDSARLTQSVSNIIRQQRHLATRVVIATQEPTVIPPTILDLASIIICHRFSSPAWCTYLSRHVAAGSDSASWHKEVMLLATGDALVFSPAAAIGADEDGGVRLLGREHIKLRVRPRLTLDGGGSRLAVGSPASSLSHSDVEEAIVASPDFSSTIDTGIPKSASESEVVRSTLRPSHREVPARLKHLVGWLTRNGGADVPLGLDDVHTALFWVGKQAYAGMSKKQWWDTMIREAVEAGLVELIEMDGDEKVLKAHWGREKTPSGYVFR
ncbi:hypothetical protein C8F04DRAFT_1130573 [Mycena alexandri]|uniref:AAA+ ATPase domain-containing protein n=1 Tax=Mycena alexandri TaxID=1745969 RepID=A0AAD6SBG9_9AGAR|nr:hypothetical protein C8F04DRAFT_1130573 [Mycena alexandri]